ncbi:MAG: type II secretion system F family protein [Pirellulales bacterium]|nr:type II secretion system F family protein [Pirellulales bacterium]
MSILIPIAAFFGVAALVGGLALWLRGGTEEAMESRLAQLTLSKNAPRGDLLAKQSVLLQPLDISANSLSDAIARYLNLQLLFDQAAINLTPLKFMLITAGCAGAGMLTITTLRLHAGIALLVGLLSATFPLLYVLFMRSRRFAAFGKQLPDALELIGRALRSGHSIGAGCNLVAEEMSEPIAGEFKKVFEEQNLGITLEEALNNMTSRVPNLDLKFFATAVILQRQTGGDLAEILDKIGDLIRERFQIWGQVQALTGEGRLSGIVLLALPPALFVAVYRLNPDYLNVLFTDPLGKQMLAGGIFMQLLGALVIRKIVNIQV